ncbi:MAG TPA: CPBP family intramembrane glutamic endopeptidase [Gemmatimonas sp.]|nr:CPBP family intramembrane glutamic endopeptidase [Gemmatimonas sp.]
MLFGACIVLAAGIAESVVGPLAGVVSRAIGEPVVAFTWTNLVAVTAATAIALRMVDDLPWSAVALGTGAWSVQRLAIGWMLGAALIVTVAATLYMLGFLHFDRVPDLLGGSGDGSPATAWTGAAIRMLVFLAPAALFEEIAFRGYLWRVAEDAGGTRVALVTTSVLFGLVHLQNSGAGVRTTLLVTLAGMSLGALRQFSGSVPAAFTAHLAWNWIMAALLHVPVSGIGMATPGYRAVLDGPAWLTGGSWGPEGGAVAGVAMGGALLIAMRRSGSWTQRTTRTGTQG